MMGKIPCRVKVAFEGYQVGDIFYPPGTYRDVLIMRGLVEFVMDDPVPEIVAEVDAERQFPVKRGRGRPRKNPIN